MRIRRLKRTGYFTIDNEVYKMRLGPFPLLVYAALSFHANRSQRVFCSQSLLAEELGISRPTCNTALQFLEEKGLISIETENGGGKRNVYTLLPVTKSNVNHAAVNVNQTARNVNQTAVNVNHVYNPSPKTRGNSLSIGELCLSAFSNNTSKQNNITKLDEQNSPRYADKSSFEQDPQGNTTPDGVAEQNPQGVNNYFGSF